MTKLRKPLLPHQIRPCGLVRVSSEEQVDQFSLPMQSLKIQEYCQSQLGVSIDESAIFREEGISGRPGTLKRRPGLNAAIEACLNGIYTHLVVHKLDRLGRNVGLVSSVLETLDEHGIVFISVQDKVDASTAAGRLYIAIFIAIAQWYSDNLSEETKKGKEGRKRAGLYNGALAFGAMPGEDTRSLPLPDIRPLTLAQANGLSYQTTLHAGLIHAFELCAQGETARMVARKMNALGYRTTGTKGQNLFTKDTIQKLLGNRFYLGELPDGNGGWVAGKHQPLIPLELWNHAQQVRQRHRRNPQTIPGNAHPHILGGGLLRCSYCLAAGRDSALHVGKSNKSNNDIRYACYGRIQGHNCKQPSVPESILEQQIELFFAEFAFPDDYQEQILAMAAKEREANATTGEMIDPVAQRAQLEARMQRQQELYELGDWSREKYLAARQEIQTEIDTIMVVQQPEQHPEEIGRLGAYVREVIAAWKDADRLNRRLLVRTLFETIWVFDHQIVAIQAVPQFMPFFALARHAVDRGSDGRQESLRDTKKPACTRVGDRRV